MIYEKEIKKIIPFKIASEKNKIPRNKLNQGGKDSYFAKIFMLLKAIYRLHAILIKISSCFSQNNS